MREVLERAAAEGLPGEHHFYLTFRTGFDGVEVPSAFRARYPETMTIVLQHQYESLAVDAEGFEVTLRFGGSWERLRVPFPALTAFLDPSVPFGLDFTQFGEIGEADAAGAGSGSEPSGPERVPADESSGEPEATGGRARADLRPVAAERNEGEPDETPAGEGPRGGDLLPFRRP